MRSYQKIQWLVVVLSLLIGLVGCDSGDGGLTTPSNVTAGNVTFGSNASPANFWVGRGANKLGIFKADSVFQVQAPEGTYLIEYTLKGGGSFFIVFTAGEDGAFLAVGLLPGDELDDVFVYEGDLIDDDVEPEFENEGVSVYCWPGSTTTTLTWNQVFVINPTITVIILVLDGEICDDGELEIEELEQVKCTYTITTAVNDQTLGSIDPEGPIDRPCGSSKSFKIHVNNALGFVPGVTVSDVTLIIDGVAISVLNQVQILGNGDGHLVIHKIDMNIAIEVDFM
jgi:hypothetical protein